MILPKLITEENIKITKVDQTHLVMMHFVIEKFFVKKTTVPKDVVVKIIRMLSVKKSTRILITEDNTIIDHIEEKN
jgi:hypothetical protein